jgi:hypothetical protein
MINQNPSYSALIRRQRLMKVDLGSAHLVKRERSSLFNFPLPEISFRVFYQLIKFNTPLG